MEEQFKHKGFVCLSDKELPERVKKMAKEILEEFLSKPPSPLCGWSTELAEDEYI